jgi:hypothetical protein
LQLFRRTIGLRFAGFVAQHMRQLVCHRKLPQIVRAHLPPHDELAGALRYDCNQRFFDESLSLRKISERGAVRIYFSRHHNILPVRRTDQHPGPFAKLGNWVLCEGLPQDRHIDLAFAQTVTDVADEVLRGHSKRRPGLGNCLWLESKKQNLRSDPQTSAEFHGTPPLVSAKLVDTRIYYNASALIQSAHFGRISLH